MTCRCQKAIAVQYKFGVCIPRTVKEAYAFDKKNNNTFWADAIKLELAQLFDYKTFKNTKKKNYDPHSYIMIPCHMIFDCNENDQRKACFVAGSHCNSLQKNSVYSSVAFFCSIWIVTFLAELNGLKLYAADIGNAYLESYTKEHCAFKAGPKFGPLKGISSLSARLYIAFAALVLDFMKSWLIQCTIFVWSTPTLILMFGTATLEIVTNMYAPMLMISLLQ